MSASLSQDTPPNGEGRHEQRQPWQKPAIEVLSMKRTYHLSSTNNDGNGSHTDASS
jgi:hypothetical protein